MKQIWLTATLVVGLFITLVPTLSEAARLGGGRSSGMQRAAPTKPTQATPAPPTAPAATPNTPGTPAPAAGKRSWLGPIAGLAAGLGLAALFSHFGMGEQFSSFIMIALLAMVALVVIRLLMRRFAAGNEQGPPFALAGAATAGAAPAQRQSATARDIADSAASTSGLTIGSALTPATTAAATANAVPALPADFDAPAFERLAKTIFIRLQAANDSADLNDLRTFTTPELFASLRLDLHERGAAVQQTDVVSVEAQLIDFAQEPERQIVSVRFRGQVREQAGAQPTPFDEVWHLTKPQDDSQAWAIAGIQQIA